MPRTRFVPSAVLAIVAFVFATASASAQDVRWRHDYTAARKEAADTGKPLLLDFGTEACGWCRKLDATTLRDPKVVKALNERFIPVKLDGNKEQRLTNALGIDGFPTLILATPDGKVVGRHAGYADVAQLTALLNKAPAPVAAAPTAAAPARPTTGNADASDADRAKRFKEQIDADLAALYPKIAAALDR